LKGGGLGTGAIFFELAMGLTPRMASRKSFLSVSSMSGFFGMSSGPQVRILFNLQATFGAKIVHI
jgi:hypothetical protein